MAYETPSPIDFAFGLDAYEPVTDFGFYPTAKYAFVTPPSVIRFYHGHWQTGVYRQQESTAVSSTSVPISTTRRQASQQAKPLEALALGLYWGEVTKSEVKVGFSHGKSQRKEAATGDHWLHTGNKDSQRSQRWDQSIQATDEASSDRWNQPSERDNLQSSPFRRVDEFSPPHQIDKFGYLLPGASLLNFRFAGQPYSPEATPAVYFRMGHKREGKVIQPRDSKRSSIFQSNRAGDQPVILPWGLGQKAKDETITGNYGGETDPDIVEKPEPEQPEIRESYLLMNIITTVVLPTRTPIELPSMEISLDIDSFSWSFTGQLWGASNLSHWWNRTKMVRSRSRWISTAGNGYLSSSVTALIGASGMSVTQSMAAAELNCSLPLMRHSEARATAPVTSTPKQAITEELANTGFTATYPDLNDYSTPDWIMPGGSFSYQNQTAMQMVAKIAGNSRIGHYPKP